MVLEKSTSAIDPAQFIVRDENYPQNFTYTGLCCRLTAGLIERKPQSLSEAVRVAQELKKPDEIAHSSKDDFLEMRSPYHSQSKTGLNTRSSCGQHTQAVLQAHGKTWEEYQEKSMKSLTQGTARQKKPKQITHRKKGFPTIEAGRVTDIEIAFPLVIDEVPDGQNAWLLKEYDRAKKNYPGSEPYEHEHRWAMASRLYRTAIGKPARDEKFPTNAKRKNAAIELYWLLSVDLPFQRGSASFARIMLEALAHQIGFVVPYTKEGHDMNIEAAANSYHAFRRRWNNGDFFDYDATAEQILDWQKQRITERSAAPTR